LAGFPFFSGLLLIILGGLKASSCASQAKSEKHRLVASVNSAS
jgi:hypothetical protein